MDDSGRAVGSIMIKDVKHLLTASEANRDYRSDIVDGLHGIKSSLLETLFNMNY